MASIKELNYTPNVLAKSIFKRESSTVGLMIPNLSNPFFNQLASSIEANLLKRDYALFLCNTNDEPEKERYYIEQLASHRVAGIIASRPLCSKPYLDAKIPTVSFENRISEHTPSISTDNYRGGFEAFDRLYETGARRILHLTGPDIFEAVAERRMGFEDAAKRRHIVPQVIHFEQDFREDMLSVSLLNSIDWTGLDAVFVFNDIAAAFVIRHLNSMKIRIPDDIQIIGFDNSYIGRLLFPSLSTFEQSPKEIGLGLVETLLALIQGETEIQTEIRFKPKWIPRESTK